MKRFAMALFSAPLAAAAVRIVLKRRSAGQQEDVVLRDREPREDAGAPPSDEKAGSVVEHEHTCDCGAAYRYTGEGRHRVYWKADASVSDPVLDDACVECGKPLPGGHPRETAEQSS